MVKKLFFVICFSLFFCSCADKLDFTDVNINEHYQLSVPKYLNPCNDLYKNAVLQLQSTDDDVYLIVIDEKKSVIHNLGLYYNLDSYYSTVLKQPFTGKLLNAIADSTPVQKQIAGYKTILTTITGGVDNEKVFYKLAVIDTPESFYQIVIWTRADKKADLENYMIKIIESFKKREENEKS